MVHQQNLDHFFELCTGVMFEIISSGKPGCHCSLELLGLKMGIKLLMLKKLWLPLCRVHLLSVMATLEMLIVSTTTITAALLCSEKSAYIETGYK